MGFVGAAGSAGNSVVGCVAVVAGLGAVAAVHLGRVGFGASLSPMRFHAALLFAISTSSSKVFVAGASLNMLPGSRFENCTFAAIFTSLLLSILNI